MLKIWQIARKSIALCFPGLHAFSKVWLKLNEMCRCRRHLKILTLDICRVYRMTQSEFEESDMYAVHRTASPKFSSVSFYDHPFSRYCTFQDFLIASHVKISKCHKIFILGQIPKTFITLHSLIPALFIIKFGSYQIQTVGRVAF